MSVEARAALLDEAEGVVDYLREKQGQLDREAVMFGGPLNDRVAWAGGVNQAADLIERLAQELHGYPY